MRGFIWGGVHGFIRGGVWFYSGGMRGFIRGVCGFSWGHAWFIWGGMHGFSGGACVVFSVFSDTMRYSQ